MIEAGKRPHQKLTAIVSGNDYRGGERHENLRRNDQTRSFRGCYREPRYSRPWLDGDHAVGSALLRVPGRLRLGLAGGAAGGHRRVRGLAAPVSRPCQYIGNVRLRSTGHANAHRAILHWRHGSAPPLPDVAVLIRVRVAHDHQLESIVRVDDSHAVWHRGRGQEESAALREVFPETRRAADAVTFRATETDT